MYSPFGRWFNGVNRWFGNLFPRRTPIRTKPRRCALNVESLEDRLVPAVYNVMSTADGLGMVTATHTAGVFDATTLRAAITAANAHAGGNTINLCVAGTYQITLPANGDDNNTGGAFTILPGGGNLTIDNNSHGAVTVNGNHLDRVFDINPNFNPASPTTAFTVTLEGFTITGGLATNAANPDGPDASGAGIRDQGNASLTLTNMAVSGNSATADGGGVSMENTVSAPWTLTINSSLISNNHAGDAGGGIEEDGSGRVFINAGTIITGNTSVNQGAGIWLDAIQDGNVFQSANLTVNGVLISDNQALASGNDGGGIGNAGNGTVNIISSTIENNYANGMGGGFGDQNNQGTLNVVDSLFLNNIAAQAGGGIETAGPLTTITSSEIKGNQSGESGGGIYAGGTTLVVQSSTIADNISAMAVVLFAGGGGGIELNTTGTGLNASSITDTTITGNLAINSGGAAGGGIEVLATGDLVLLNDTINANQATTAAGGIYWVDGQGPIVTVQNTIIAGNFAPTGTDADNIDFLNSASFTDNGGNLIGLAGSTNGNVGFTAATTQVGTTTPLNPLLAPLGNYGGPVIGAPGNTIVLQTEALQIGSPAIGKGVLSRAPAYDERGFQSGLNGVVNVGAVSAVVPALASSISTTHVAQLIVTSIVNGVKTTCYYVNSTADLLTPPAGILTLRAAVEDADNTTGNKVIYLMVGGTYGITIPQNGNDNNTGGAFTILPDGGNVAIVNASHAAVTVNGNHLDRVFDINPDFNPASPTPAFTVTLQGFTITGGMATDPYNPDGPGATGGGIRDQGNASLTLTNIAITGNTASADGGGLSMENTVSAPWTLTINASLISNNHAGDAGGGVEEDGSGRVFINAGTVITANTSVNQGAGIWLDGIQDGNIFQTANLSVTGAIISDNNALASGSDGGGIGNAGNGVVTLTSTTLAYNFVNGSGGGFGDQNGLSDLNVTDCFFIGNIAAAQGGGIETAGPTTIITSSQLQHNETGLTGGGLFAGGTNVNLRSDVFASNIAAGGGAGIELEITGAADITDSTIFGNLALNNAGANGGGIDFPAISNPGSVKLLNDTINLNLATNGGGIFSTSEGFAFALQNTIVAQNLSLAGVGPDIDNGVADFMDLGGNLIGLAGPNNGNVGLGLASGGFASTLVGTTTPLNPLLGPLANNGGPTVGAPGDSIVLESEALESGSPALGKGIVIGAPTTDGRGLPSIVNGKINIGAF